MGWVGWGEVGRVGWNSQKWGYGDVLLEGVVFSLLD